MKINKCNLIIYIISLSISVVCIGLFFIDPNNAGCILSCSIGASGLGAVLLGFFLENANNVNREKNIQKNREDILHPIILMLRSSICNFIKLLDECGYTIKSKTVHDFLNEFEDLHISIASGENEFWNNINQANYLKKVKRYFSRAAISSNAIIEINNNRSFIINSGLLTDNEIRDLSMIDIFISQMENCIEIEGTFFYLINIFSYIHLKEITDIEISKNENEISFLYNNEKIHVFKD